METGKRQAASLRLAVVFTDFREDRKPPPTKGKFQSLQHFWRKHRSFHEDGLLHPSRAERPPVKGHEPDDYFMFASDRRHTVPLKDEM